MPSGTMSGWQRSRRRLPAISPRRSTSTCIATPGGQYGFGWHYDAEEVFIVQTTGRKLYSLRKNTVNPWPIEENAAFRHEVRARDHAAGAVRAGCGRLADIPSGYWHMGSRGNGHLAGNRRSTAHGASMCSIFCGRRLSSRCSGGSGCQSPGRRPAIQHRCANNTLNVLSSSAKPFDQDAGRPAQVEAFLNGAHATQSAPQPAASPAG